MFNFLKTQHIHNKISHEKSRHHRIKLTHAKFGKKEKQKVKKRTKLFWRRLRHSNRHFPENDVSWYCDVYLLNLPLLQRRDCVGVDEPDSETGHDFFFNLFGLGFRFGEPGRQRCGQRQQDLVAFPPTNHSLEGRERELKLI